MNVCIDPLKLQTEDLREITIVRIVITVIGILGLVGYLHLLLLTRQNISTFQMKAHLKIYIFLLSIYLGIMSKTMSACKL